MVEPRYSYERDWYYVNWLCGKIFESVTNPTEAKKMYWVVNAGIGKSDNKFPLGMCVDRAFELVDNILKKCADLPENSVEQHCRANQLTDADISELRAKYCTPLFLMSGSKATVRACHKKWTIPERLAEDLLMHRLRLSKFKFVTSDNTKGSCVYEHLSQILNSFGCKVTARTLKDWIAYWEERQNHWKNQAKSLFWQKFDTELRKLIEDVQQKCDIDELVYLENFRYDFVRANQDFAKAVKNSNIPPRLSSFVELFRKPRI